MGPPRNWRTRSARASAPCWRNGAWTWAYGRKLPRLLREAGLTDVEADAYFPVARSACAPLETATIQLIRHELLTHRIATAEEIDRHLGNVAAGTLDLSQPPMITAWGRKP